VSIEVDTARSVNYGCSVPTITDVQPETPSDGLAAVVALRRLADRLEAAEVERAIRQGWTWGRIAEALGVTRQAVHKKYAKRVEAAGIRTTRRRDG
jgi:CRP-like cAMP-binding protein